MNKQVGVGVGVYIVCLHQGPRTELETEMYEMLHMKAGEPLILMGKRKGSHGAGTWSVPGGHIDFGESALETCYRELEEETGITRDMIADLAPVTFTESVFEKEQKHYITLVFHGILKANVDMETVNAMLREPKEPEKCSAWRWFSKNSMPKTEELFLPVRGLIKKGFNIFTGDHL